VTSVEKRAADVIRQELGRLLDSDALRRAPSHTRLLRYLVETSLSGDENALRELAIGVHVFRRNPTTFDPKRDPIVRVTTGRLRAWLESHYHRTNGDPAVRITLPRGCYAPVFHAVSVTARKPWDDRARDLVERARYLLLQRNPEQANLALRLAEQAARDAPQSSAAWSTLAACRFQLLSLMAVEPGVTMATLRHEAETALRLDGENAEALALLATMVHWQQFDMRSALSLYERAVRIEPANAMVRARFSASLMYAGRFEEAGAMIMVARTLDPLNLSLRLSEALLHSYARNHEKARRGTMPCWSCGPITASRCSWAQ